MIAVALRGLWGRKLRATLTAIAIVLGVATVTGTYILTDSISSAFDSIFTGIYRGTDAAITGRSAITSSTSNTELPSFDESLLQKVRRQPEVAAAVGGVGGEAQLIGRNGKVIAFGGAPNLGFSVDPLSLSSTRSRSSTASGRDPARSWSTAPLPARRTSRWAR